MKVIFTLGSPAIGGGTNVIFEHATKMVDMGEDVYIITDRKIDPEEYQWHASAHKLKWITYDDVDKMEFDIAIATWWRTVYELYRIKSKQYLYFVQSIESKFYPESEVGIRILSELTYSLNLKVITEATWIKEYLENNYGLDVILVRNGIKKDVFKLDGEHYKKCDGLRVLIEGPVDVGFKNVPKTIELVKQSKASEIWLLTSSKIDNYEGVDRVFSQVPVKDCAKIYRSCDVIVKLSYVEGMFGPPLEMFHCGGTCIVYDVTGYDEYIENEVNGIVVKTDDEATVISSINRLLDKKYLNKLKKNAIKTANNWMSWDESSLAFYKAVKEHNKKPKHSQQVLETQSKFFFNIYVKYENKNIGLKKQLGIYARDHFPKLYKIYYKIRSKK